MTCRPRCGRPARWTASRRVRLVLHGDVAPLVRRGAADHRHVDGERAEEQPLPAGPAAPRPAPRWSAPALLASAPPPGVDEGVEAGPRQEARPARGHVAGQLRHDAHGPGVALQLAFQRQLTQAGRVAQSAGDAAAHESLLGQLAHPDVFPIAQPNGAQQLQLPGRPRLNEVLLQPINQLLGGIAWPPPKPPIQRVSLSLTRAAASNAVMTFTRLATLLANLLLYKNKPIGESKGGMDSACHFLPPLYSGVRSGVIRCASVPDLPPFSKD